MVEAGLGRAPSILLLAPAGQSSQHDGFPKGMDANEYALKIGPAAKSLGVAIRSAQWLGKGQAKPITTAAATAVLKIKDAAAPLVAEKKSLAEPAEPLPQLPAQALPDAPCAAPPTPSIKSIAADHEYAVTFGDRRYRVRGLEKSLSYEVLKVNVLASRQSIDSAGKSVHVDTFDLYQARHRAAFVKQAAAKLGVSEEIIKADLGKLLLALEAEQEKLITAAQEPQASAVVKIDDTERDAALALLLVLRGASLRTSLACYRLGRC